MFTAYLLVKMIHILCAIVGMGLALSFAFIMPRAAQSPSTMPFALTTVQAMTRVVTWAFTFAIVSGAAMGHLGGISFKTFWFTASLVIALVAMGLAGSVAGPALKKQIALVGQGEGAAAELRRLGGRSAAVGVVLHLLSLVLISLMVFKPTLD